MFQVSKTFVLANSTYVRHFPFGISHSASVVHYPTWHSLVWCFHQQQNRGGKVFVELNSGQTDCTKMKHFFLCHVTCGYKMTPIFLYNCVPQYRRDVKILKISCYTVL